jgi:superfamily I DNA and/or RNA helicase
MTISARRGGGVLSIQKGNITYIHGDPEFAKITVTGSENQAYVSPKLVTKHNLRVGDLVEFKSKTYDKGPSVTEFTKVRGNSVTPVNAQEKSRKRKNHSNKNNGGSTNSKSSNKGKIARTISKIKNRYRGSQGFLRRLFLVAMGGSKTNYSALESRAESLEPFIEYVEHSKEAYKHLQKTARFKWEPVENEKFITVTKQLGVKIRVKPENLPYLLINGPPESITEETKLMHPKGHTADILVVKSNSTGVEFLTSRDLNSQGWQIFGGHYHMAEIEWDHNSGSKPIEKVSIGTQDVNILNQSKKGEWIELVLEIEKKATENKQILIDGRNMEWELISQPDFIGPLNDGGSGRQVISRVKLNQPATIRYLPSGNFLYDPDGVRYTFKKSTTAGDSLKLKLRLDEVVEQNLDEDRDTNPMDILFSPDSEYKELIVNYRWDKLMAKQNKIIIKSKDANTKTITIKRPKYFKLKDTDVLSLRPNLFYIERQLEMLQILRDYPLPHHDALLKLTEQGTGDAREKLWQPFESRDELEWKILTRNTDGTEEQRDFVRKAVSTPDFAILQGPPGSGKTTAIIELIAQFAAQNKKVLLCGSTQASIDNVLLRIKENKNLHDLISPLRIGRKEGIYDTGVHDFVLSEQMEHMMEIGLSEEEAQDLILRQTNLTCGTMAGIIGHPLIKNSKDDQGKRLKTPQAHFDVLIVDEASKTTFQQFIIPAAFSRKWVLVGDVRQLPPFLEASELMTNLESMNDSAGEPYTHAAQRACLLLRNFGRFQAPKSGHPIVIIEGEGVPLALINEMNARNGKFMQNIQITVIGSRASDSIHESVHFFSPKEIINSAEANIYLHSSDIIVIGSDCYPKIAELLPAHSIIRNGTIETKEVTANRMTLYENRQDNVFPDERHPMNKASLLTEWTYQISWRLNRSYELKVSKNTRQKEQLERDIMQYMPRGQDVSKRLEEIRSIALPSVLECLQYGFATGKAKKLLPETTLTCGFPSNALSSRFSRINFQHRMHPDISSFSRNEFYEDEALIDADTLQLRDANYPFVYRANQPRNTWIDAPAGKGDFSINWGEITAIKAELKQFIQDARKNKPSNPRRDNPTQWEIAVLSPYQKQRKALVEMVQQLTGQTMNSMRFNLAEMKNPSPITIVVSTTDRFQGQEADIVFISLRNSNRVGFLDSPNRMNVAITRAREWRVIVGNYEYFARDKQMKDPMLRSLALTHLQTVQKPGRN